MDKEVRKKRGFGRSERLQTTFSAHVVSAYSMSRTFLKKFPLFVAEFFLCLAQSKCQCFFCEESIFDQKRSLSPVNVFENMALWS
ncbi:hypothetical protein CSA57_12685 [candidate division KSB3 bacterium]|nr:MAG: hypothetical protein CSA57_12685 [candidate division KSB3 bacterium]